MKSKLIIILGIFLFARTMRAKNVPSPPVLLELNSDSLLDKDASETDIIRNDDGRFIPLVSGGRDTKEEEDWKGYGDDKTKDIRNEKMESKEMIDERYGQLIYQNSQSSSRIPFTQRDIDRNNVLNSINVSSEAQDVKIVESKDAIVIDLEKLNKMSTFEYISRSIRSIWTRPWSDDGSSFLGGGNQSNCLPGRCFGVAKRIKQMIPFVMIGGGIIVTKLAFLVLFSLKSLGLLTLLLLLNVGTIAAKVGAFLASKKTQNPQNIHVHVEPYKHDEYISTHSGGHYHDWEDRIDNKNLEGHELYNLYEKLRRENELRKYFSR